MWDQEEIEFTIFDFGLFNKASINVGALRRVLNEFVSLLSLALLEESLTDPFVHNDKGNLGCFDLNCCRYYRFHFIFAFFFSSSCLSCSCSLSGLSLSCLILLLLEKPVLLCHNLVKLIKLFVNNHLAHTVSNTVSVDEDVLGHRSIEVTVTLESTLEVI